MRTYVIEVDGESFSVEGQQGVFDLLDQIDFLANEDDFDIEVIQPPRIRVKTAAGKPTQSKKITTAVDETRRRIAETYRRRAEKIRRERAIDSEISDLMLQQIAREDEENAILALLL